MTYIPVDRKSLPKFPKPIQAEGRVKLSPKQCREQLQRKIKEQHDLCARCHSPMYGSPGTLMSPTRDHIRPQPAGCRKDDSDDNIQAVHWICNFEKGSKRI